MTLDDLYAKIPRIACKGKCQQSCGPVGMSKTEAKAIESAAPGLIQTEPFAGGTLLVSNFTEEMHCPALQHGRCAIYANRPMICRLWGVTKDMRCPWGCRPARWLDKSECHELLRLAESASM